MANTNGGYILLARKVMENELWVFKPALWYKTWIYILMEVNHTPSKLFPRGTGLFLWKNVKDANPELTSDIWYNLRKWLKQAEQITEHRTTHGVVISVLNYETYQNPKNYKTEHKTEHKTEQQRNSNGTATDILHNELKELNKDTLSVSNLTTKNQDKDKEVSNKEVKKKDCIYMVDLFNLFWDTYPRKVNKVLTVRSWNKLNPDKELVCEILKKLEIQKQSEGWLKERGQFIPHPSTYLNGKRWEDEVKVVEDWQNE